MTEKELLMTLNNKRIIKLYAFFEYEGYWHYVIEYHKNGDLKDLLDKKSKISLFILR